MVVNEVQVVAVVAAGRGRKGARTAERGGRRSSGGREASRRGVSSDVTGRRAHPAPRPPPPRYIDAYGSQVSTGTGRTSGARCTGG